MSRIALVIFGALLSIPSNFLAFAFSETCGEHYQIHQAKLACVNLVEQTRREKFFQNNFSDEKFSGSGATSGALETPPGPHGEKHSLLHNRGPP